jgi:N-acetylmuramoyl-L-alanine amidase
LQDVKAYVEAWETYKKVEATKPAQPKAVVETGKEDLIRHGDKGQHVKELQEKLIAKGFALPRFGADGHFGDETETALRAFQTAAGIGVDGIFGPQSASALESFKAPAPKPEYKRLIRLTSPFMRGDDVKAIQ